MDHRVQRLHPAVEHLGEAGQRRDVADRQPGRRAAPAAVPPVETSSTPRGGERARRARRGRSCRKRRAARGGSGTRSGGIGGGLPAASGRLRRPRWRLGDAAEGPGDLAEILDHLGADNHLLRRQRRRRVGVEVDRVLEPDRAAAGAEQPVLARRQRQQHELPRRVELGRDVGVQVEARGEADAPARRHALELGAGAGVGDGEDLLAAQPPGRGRRRRAAAPAAARGSRRSRPGWRAATGRWRPAPGAPRRGPGRRRARRRRCARRGPCASKRADGAAVDLDGRMRRGLAGERAPSRRRRPRPARR